MARIAPAIQRVTAARAYKPARRKAALNGKWKRWVQLIPAQIRIPLHLVSESSNGAVPRMHCYVCR